MVDEGPDASDVGPDAPGTEIMWVRLEQGDSEVIALVHGEVDADNCHEFRAALLDETDGPIRLTVDLAGLGFIDSSGISELLTVAEVVRDRGQDLSLRKPSPAVHRLLKITGLLEHFGLS